jgi:hypothetical protein
MLVHQFCDGLDALSTERAEIRMRLSFAKELDAKIFIDIVMTLEPSVDRGRSSR